MLIELKILNRLRYNKIIAGELVSANTNKRTWIGIYPLTNSEFLYRIRKFDVDKKYLENDNNVWEETMENKKDFYANTEEQLLKILEKNFPKDLKLTNPWECNYPI